MQPSLHAFQELLQFLNETNSAGFERIERTLKATVSPVNPDMVLRPDIIDTFLVAINADRALLTELNSLIDVVNCYMVFNHGVPNIFAELIEIICMSREEYKNSLLSEQRMKDVELRPLLTDNNWILGFYLVSMVFVTQPSSSQE